MRLPAQYFCGHWCVAWPSKAPDQGALENRGDPTHHLAEMTTQMPAIQGHTGYERFSNTGIAHTPTDMFHWIKSEVWGAHDQLYRLGVYLNFV